MDDATGPAPDLNTVLVNKKFIGLLVIAGVIGVIASLASWGLLEAIYQLQHGIFTDLPKELFDNGTPDWWSLPFCLIAGLITALAITRLPGNGGHIPAYGLAFGGSPPNPIDLPGVLLAAIATIGLGIVLGPEAPLLALGGGLGVLAIRLAAKESPPQVLMVAAAAGSFAALSFIFGSPLIAAVLLIEATGIGGDKLPIILLPGLLAAGIGSLVSLGMGSLTGLSSSHWALSPLKLPDFARPDLTDFLWTIPLAIAIAVGVYLVILMARKTVPFAIKRPFIVLPLIGLVVSLCAIAFAQISGETPYAVLFSGQDALPQLVKDASHWSTSTLLLLLLFKGIAWSVALGGFRGGPTFPAMFLGAAMGILFAGLPGLDLTAAVAVGIAAGVVAVLRLPLSAVVLGSVLVGGTGGGATPLIIVGVVTAYLVTLGLSKWRPLPTPIEVDAPEPAPPTPAGNAAPSPAPA